MSQEISKKLEEIFFNIFPAHQSKNFQIDQHRDQFEDWDSLTHMQIVSEVETVFLVSFDIDEVAQIEKPSDFIALIIKKRNE